MTLYPLNQNAIDKITLELNKRRKDEVAETV
jgi:hypothetical protein